MKFTKILIIEDDPIVSDDIERTVKALGATVVGCAATGEEAIRLARETSPDVVLTDITLKGTTDGIVAATAIKAEMDAAIIFLTAHSDPATFERAKITEPYGYIVKPFNETDLRITIGLALYKRRSTQANNGQVSKLRDSVEKLNERSADDPSDERTNCLKEVELFSLLTEVERRTFASQCRIAQYSSGEIIVCEGGDQSYCYIVLEGRVSMFKSSPNGRELVVEILGPKDISNLTAAFDEQLAAVTVRAVAKAKILVIPKRALFELLNKHPEFYQVFTRRASQRLRAAYNFMRAMAHDKVEVRIASMLAELSKRTSLCTQPDGGIKITRQELADLTGTTAETAIRVTRALEDRGILGLSKRGVISINDINELKEYAETL